MEDRFYDLCYEEWMNGGNPDDIQEDAYDNMRSYGFYPDEIQTEDIGGRKNEKQ